MKRNISVKTNSYREHAELICVLHSFGLTKEKPIFDPKNKLTNINIADSKKVLFDQAKTVFDNIVGFSNKKQKHLKISLPNIGTQNLNLKSFQI